MDVDVRAKLDLYYTGVDNVQHPPETSTYAFDIILVSWRGGMNRMQRTNLLIARATLKEAWAGIVVTKNVGILALKHYYLPLSLYGDRRRPVQAMQVIRRIRPGTKRMMLGMQTRS
jgi:hypothetical protein